MEFSLPKTQINLSDKFNRLIIRRYNFYSLVLNLLISVFTSLHFTSRVVQVLWRKRTAFYKQAVVFKSLRFYVRIIFSQKLAADIVTAWRHAAMLRSEVLPC